MTFAIFGNIYQEHKAVSTGRLLRLLAERGAHVFIDHEYRRFLLSLGISEASGYPPFMGRDFQADIACSMGGDGTMLRTAARVGDKETPIMGVNMGRLGFMANVRPDELEKAVDALYTGQYALDKRAIIQVEANGRPLSEYPIAINDVAVLKRDTASMITIHTQVGDEHLTTYQADGVIVSTSTGSTAYSLSNGGPIIVPGSGVFCITAVAPHSLNMRPVVIPETREVSFEVESRSHGFLVAIDGRAEKLDVGTRVTLRRAPYSCYVVKRQDSTYFATLREKMMWGADTRA